MPLLLGENVNIGIGVEAVRGTPVAPADWIPGRTPTGVRPVLEKVLVKETRMTRFDTQDSEIVQKRAEGDLEFNVRYLTIGYLLKSLFGAVVSGAVGGQAGAYDHVFDIDIDNPQNPSLTLAVTQGTELQNYEYPNAVVKSLEIRTPVNDLVNATVSFLATKENTHADYSPAFSANDKYFRHYDLVIKIAANVAGLGAAPALNLKDFSIMMDNNARVDQNIGNINPADVYAMLMNVGGSMTLDKLDETYHDIFAAGSYRAMSIKMTRTDTTIGSSTNPSLEIILPKISIENLNPDRPIDDVVRDVIEFKAHHDLTLGYGIRATLRNTLSDYDA